MNKNNLFAVLAFSLLLFTTGCEKTEPDINTDDREKFIGTWNAISTGPGGTRNFTLVIVASNSAPDQIILKGFDGGSANSNLPALVNGNNLAIVTTVISGETIAGSGSYSNGTLNFDFTVDDGQTLESRTCTATK
jgi:hypothetical protein